MSMDLKHVRWCGYAPQTRPLTHGVHVGVSTHLRERPALRAGAAAG